MRYIDICSGISAPTAAWKPLGWQALCYAEIEAAPRAVLAHHYPDVPLVGDFTQIEGTEYGPVDLLVGGTPCQSFSIAGLRGGLADERGNLALEYLRLAHRSGARWLVWENVPGVLSIDGGRAFGAILGGMAELGYGFAYRVLDAQHFGVPQRRRRVFAVGYLGDWRRAAAVLFERHGLSGHPAPRRREGQSTAPCIDASFGRLQGCSGQDANHGHGHLIAFNSRQEPVSSDEAFGTLDTCHPQAQAVAFSIMPMNSGKDYKARQTDVAQPIMAGGPVGGNQGGDYVCQPVAYPINPNALRGDSRAKRPSKDAAGVMRLRDPGLGVGQDGDPADTLQAAGPGAVGTASAVRRLTPRECERLQGFPDDFTLVPYRGRMMADGPRYKMLGNSMARPVMRWLGERIAMVDALPPERFAV